MKKRFLTAIALLFSLSVLVGCNNKGNDNQSQEEPATSIEPCEKHTWGEKVTIKEPTCTEEGQTQRTCTVCGAKEEPKTVKALGHKYDDGAVTKNATCGDPGIKTFTCERCGDTYEEKIYVPHTWSETSVPLTVGDSDAIVNEFTCTICGKKKLEWAGKQATGRYTISGSTKSDDQFPDYLKLSTNDNYITYTFPYTAAGKAIIYMRGVMDYWKDGNQDNQARAGYYAGKNSSDGNFELKVNNEVVDYSWSKGLTYEDLLPGEAQGSYSALNDCKVGECNIINGQNTVTFTRKESYNLLIKDFVIIFE